MKATSSFSYDASVLASALGLRIAIALLIRTSFAPDEHFQGPEAALLLVDGVGQRTWEWTGEYQIRSYTYILHYVLLFQGLKILPVSSSLTGLLYRYGPRVMQGMLSAIGDYCFFRICRALDSEASALHVVYTHLLSWSGTFCMSRTLANATESSLTCIALCLILESSGVVTRQTQRHIVQEESHDVLQGQGQHSYMVTNTSTTTNFVDDRIRTQSSAIQTDKKLRMYQLGVIVATVAVYGRPTAAVYFLAYFSLAGIAALKGTCHGLVYQAALPCLMTANMCMLADTYCYGATYYVMSPWNFFSTNILQDFAALFGTHPWHWYLSQVHRCMF
jgi:phosphatidylinositol glycan class B